MSMRIVVLGVAVVCTLSAWAWCRPCAKEAQAQSAGMVVSADDAELCEGGNKDEALHRFRSNGARHWKQIALKR